MSASRLVTTGVVALGFLALGSCATAGTSLRPVHMADGTLLITADQIRQTHATDAWDVLRLTNRQVRMQGEVLAGEARVSRPGSTSIVLDDALLIVIDGVRTPDASALRDVPASVIASIRIMTGVRATQLFGTGAGGGAVVVETGAPGR